MGRSFLVGWRAAFEEPHELELPADSLPLLPHPALDPAPPPQANFQSYIALLDAYSVVPASERAKLRRSGTADPARRREEKIAQFRWEKDVRDRLRVRASPPSLSLDAVKTS